MKVTIIKVTADGEQLSVEWPVPQEFIKLHQAGTRHIRESLGIAFDLADARLLEMNKRIMASNYLIQKLSPEASFAVKNVMDVLHGKTSGPEIETILKEREAEMDAARAKAEAEKIQEETLLEQIQREARERHAMPPIPQRTGQEESPKPAPRRQSRHVRASDGSASVTPTAVDPTIPGGV